eukprot:c18150_g1_i5.p1 GENE.c18150_g1_i5~~c18150_g1_i5.p1  ORF type:complete len:124 (+),score=15.97 c18150_g1_i5:153-524(+)
MFYAITRLSRHVTPNEIPHVSPFQPDQCLSFEQALDLYTINAATAVGRSHDLGRLEPGYWADFIILDKDVSQNPELLLSASCTHVWVAGALVVDSENSVANIGIETNSQGEGCPCCRDKKAAL